MGDDLNPNENLTKTVLSDTDVTNFITAINKLFKNEGISSGQNTQPVENSGARQYNFFTRTLSEQDEKSKQSEQPEKSEKINLSPYGFYTSALYEQSEQPEKSKQSEKIKLGKSYVGKTYTPNYYSTPLPERSEQSEKSEQSVKFETNENFKNMGDPNITYYKLTHHPTGSYSQSHRIDNRIDKVTLDLKFKDDGANGATKMDIENADDKYVEYYANLMVVSKLIAGIIGEDSIMTNCNEYGINIEQIEMHLCQFTVNLIMNAHGINQELTDKILFASTDIYDLFNSQIFIGKYRDVKNYENIWMLIMLIWNITSISIDKYSNYIKHYQKTIQTEIDKQDKVKSQKSNAHYDRVHSSNNKGNGNGDDGNDDYNSDYNSDNDNDNNSDDMYNYEYTARGKKSDNTHVEDNSAVNNIISDAETNIVLLSNALENYEVIMVLLLKFIKSTVDCGSCIGHSLIYVNECIRTNGKYYLSQSNINRFSNTILKKYSLFASFNEFSILNYLLDKSYIREQLSTLDINIYNKLCSKYTTEAKQPEITEPETAEVEECSICLDDLAKDIAVLKCNHLFHYECINNWRNNTLNISNGENTKCPYCKSPINIVDVKNQSKSYLNLSSVIQQVDMDTVIYFLTKNYLKPVQNPPTNAIKVLANTPICSADTKDIKDDDWSKLTNTALGKAKSIFPNKSNEISSHVTYNGIHKNIAEMFSSVYGDTDSFMINIIPKKTENTTPNPKYTKYYRNSVTNMLSNPEYSPSEQNLKQNSNYHADFFENMLEKISEYIEPYKKHNMSKKITNNDTYATFENMMSEYNYNEFSKKLHKQIKDNAITPVTIRCALNYDDPYENKADNNEPDNNEPDNNEPDNNEPDNNEADNNEADNNEADNNEPDNNEANNNEADNNEADNNEADNNEADNNEADNNDDDTNDDDTNDDDTSEDDTSEDDTSEDDTSEDDTSEDDTSEDDTSEDDTSEDDASEDDTSEDDTNEDDTKKDDTDEDENSEDEKNELPTQDKKIKNVKYTVV
jgi:hypothetical protein